MPTLTRLVRTTKGSDTFGICPHDPDLMWGALSSEQRDQSSREAASPGEIVVTAGVFIVRQAIALRLQHVAQMAVRRQEIDAALVQSSLLVDTRLEVVRDVALR